MATDILLNKDGSLKMDKGSFVIGDCEDQEIQGILEMTQGELKEDPILGADIFRLINSNASKVYLKSQVKLQLERDNKDYESLKQRIQLQVNG